MKKAIDSLLTPLSLLKDPTIAGQILHSLPRQVLEQSERAPEPWEWLSEWAKQHTTNSACRKLFAAACSQIKAYQRLTIISRGGGSVSGLLKEKLDCAFECGDEVAISQYQDKFIAAICSTKKGKNSLLYNRGVDAGRFDDATRAYARVRYKALYTADVRRLGKKKADAKWNGDGCNPSRIPANSQCIAEAMARSWVVGLDQFSNMPGLCFMKDELLASLLGRVLPVKSLLSTEIDGWKTVRTIRERIGLKKAIITLVDMRKIGNGWELLDRHGNSAGIISKT